MNQQRWITRAKGPKQYIAQTGDMLRNRVTVNETNQLPRTDETTMSLSGNMWKNMCLKMCF